jgi:hypothetical protein
MLGLDPDGRRQGVVLLVEEEEGDSHDGVA